MSEGERIRRKGRLLKDLTETDGKIAGAWKQAAANFRVVGMGCVFEHSSRREKEGGC
jgi:hypothetical protein